MAVGVLNSILSHWLFYVFVLAFYAVAFGFFSLFFYLGLSSTLYLRWISVAIFAATIVGFAVATIVYAPVRARLRKQYNVD